MQFSVSAWIVKALVTAKVLRAVSEVISVLACGVLFIFYAPRLFLSHLELILIAWIPETKRVVSLVFTTHARNRATER